MRTEAGKRLFKETRAFQSPLRGSAVQAITAIEAEARQAALREAILAVMEADLDALNPDTNRREAVEAIARLAR